MGTVCLKLGTSELDLAIRGVARRLIGARRQKQSGDFSQLRTNQTAGGTGQAIAPKWRGQWRGAARLGSDDTPCGAGSGSRSANGRPGGAGPRAGAGGQPGTARPEQETRRGTGNGGSGTERDRPRAKAEEEAGRRIPRTLEAGGRAWWGLGGGTLWRSVAPAAEAAAAGGGHGGGEGRRESEAEGEGTRAYICCACSSLSRGGGPLLIRGGVGCGVALLGVIDDGDGSDYGGRLALASGS